MSTKHVRNANHLARYKMGLDIICPCGHRFIADWAWIGKRFGTMDFNRFIHRLKCSRCGETKARYEVLLPPVKR